MHEKALSKNVVETFVQEEIQELIYDGKKLKEWNETCKELGLHNQAKLANPQKSPIPFVYMNRKMQSMFGELLPRRVDIKDFSISPIPIEILKLVQMSKRENYFGQYDVWYNEEDLDPIVTGMTAVWYYYNSKYDGDEKYKELHDGLKSKEEVEKKRDEYGFDKNGSIWTRDENYYLIGRWGDVKANFEELRKKAMDLFITKQSAQLEKRIKESQTELETIKQDAILKFT